MDARDWEIQEIGMFRILGNSGDSGDWEIGKLGNSGDWEDWEIRDSGSCGRPRDSGDWGKSSFVAKKEDPFLVPRRNRKFGRFRRLGNAGVWKNWQIREIGNSVLIVVFVAAGRNFEKQLSAKFLKLEVRYPCFPIERFIVAASSPFVCQMANYHSRGYTCLQLLIGNLSGSNRGHFYNMRLQTPRVVSFFTLQKKRHPG